MLHLLCALPVLRSVIFLLETLAEPPHLIALLIELPSYGRQVPGDAVCELVGVEFKPDVSSSIPMVQLLIVRGVSDALRI